LKDLRGTGVTEKPSERFSAERRQPEGREQSIAGMLKAPMDYRIFETIKIKF